MVPDPGGDVPDTVGDVPDPDGDVPDPGEDVPDPDGNVPIPTLETKKNECGSDLESLKLLNKLYTLV